MEIRAKLSSLRWRRWALRSASLFGLLAFVALAVGPSTPAAAQSTVVVPVGDFWFCDPSFQSGVCETKIQVGDTVEWDFSGAISIHTSTECGATCNIPTPTPFWDSGLIVGGGGPFQFTFTQPGTYLYFCEVHPFTMRGEITVNEPPAVGGFAVDLGPDRGEQALEKVQPSPGDAAVLAGLAAGLTALVAALGGATWYVRRCWLR